MISAGSVDGGFVWTPAMPIDWQCSIMSNGCPPPRAPRERSPKAEGVPPIFGAIGGAAPANLALSGSELA